MSLPLLPEHWRRSKNSPPYLCMAGRFFFGGDVRVCGSTALPYNPHHLIILRLNSIPENAVFDRLAEGYYCCAGGVADLSR